RNSQDANSLIAGLRRITVLSVLTAFSKIISLFEQKKMEDKDKKRGPNYTEKEKSTPKYAWPGSFFTLNL
ncbi:unnamed protein product, partial [Callosobruchus maculatus]